MRRSRSVRASRGVFVGLVLVALLGLGAFFWLGSGSRVSRDEPARTAELSAEPVRADAELVPAPGTSEPVRVERKEPPPEVVPVARDVAPPTPPPELGSVVVEVFAADGSYAEDGTRVDLWRGPGRRRTASRGAVRTADATATVRAGQARFEGVELDRVLELDATRRFERANATVVGPRSPGERVNVVLNLVLAGATLVFRAVDPSGQPVVGPLESELRVWNRRRTSSRPDSRTTDDQGSFEVELEAALLAGERRELVVRAGTLADERRERVPVLEGRIDLSQSFPPDRIDMGDLVLERAPLVAEGRVVDGGGKPLAGAWVSCRSARAERNEGAPLGSLGMVATDQHGRFALYAFFDAPRIELHAVRGDRRMEPLEVALGTSGLEIVLSGTGGLAGEILLDEGTQSATDLRITLSASKAPLSGATLVGSAAFEFTDLAPGTYTLRVLLRSELRAEVAGIEVVANEVARDPRLQALDLSLPPPREPEPSSPRRYRRAR